MGSQIFDRVQSRLDWEGRKREEETFTSKEVRPSGVSQVLGWSPGAKGLDDGALGANRTGAGGPRPPTSALSAGEEDGGCSSGAVDTRKDGAESADDDVGGGGAAAADAKAEGVVAAMFGKEREC